MSREMRTRFAPSPSGHLHMGHGASALLAHDFARDCGGTFVLRIEDIDLARCRPEFDAAIGEDLGWLGLTWEQPVRRQSQHFADYEAALARLQAMGLTYPCFCTRKQITAEIERAASAPHGPIAGPEGMHYPGTCRSLSEPEHEARRQAGEAFVIRLDVARAQALLRKDGLLPLFIEELETLNKGASGRAGKIEVDPALFGDIVLARKDIPTSYHVAVVVDDHLQRITHVIRGEDLREATHVHRLLQALLGYEPPVYYHHGLMRDETGRRLAKRDKDLTLRALRQAGEDAGALSSRLRRAL